MTQLISNASPQGDSMTCIIAATSTPAFSAKRADRQVRQPLHNNHRLTPETPPFIPEAHGGGASGAFS